MIYGKLVDGELRGAPRPIKTAEQLEAALHQIGGAVDENQ